MQTTDTPRHRALASKSRAGLLAMVQSAGDGLTVTEAAQASGLHPNTVRAHLDQLVEADLLTREPERAGSPGRPAWRYHARSTPESTSGLYRDLAAALVGHLARTAVNPAAAGEQAGRDWGRRLATAEAEPPAQLGPHTHPPINALADVLSKLGFTPQVVSRDGDRGGVVHLRTCPFLDLAAANQDVICGMHLGVIRGAMGALGVSTAGTALQPFGAEGACVVRIDGASQAGTARQ